MSSEKPEGLTLAERLASPRNLRCGEPQNTSVLEKLAAPRRPPNFCERASYFMRKDEESRR